MQSHPEKAWRPLLRGLRACTKKRKPSRAAIAANEAVYAAVANLLWDDQVLGYSIAEKSAGGAGTGELAVRFYVKRKVAVSRLKDHWRIPSTLPIGTGSDGEPNTVETDVIEMTSIPRAQRVLSPGVSIGHKVGTSGVLGLIVDGNTSGRFLLTCSHVAAPPVAGAGDEIESPSDPDGVAGPNTVGRLFSGTRFQNGGQYDMDAALVTPSGVDLQLTNLNLGLGSAPAFEVITPSNQMDFRGHGVRRISFGQGHDGVFDSIQNDIPVIVNNMATRFFGVFAYRSDSRDGDSGSPVVNLVTNRILGLHFAGSSVDGTGFIIPFQTIARRLNVRIAAI